MKLKTLSNTLSGLLACLMLASCNSGNNISPKTFKTPVGWIYSTLFSQNAVMAIDNAQSRIQADPIPVSNGPISLATDPRGQQAYLYVVCQVGNTVDVVDRRSSLRIRSINVGEKPYGIAISPDGLKAFVTNEDSDTVSVIDLNNRIVTQTIQLNILSNNAQPTQGQPAHLDPRGIATDWNGTHVYVACANGHVIVLTAANTSSAYTASGNVLLTGAVEPQNIAVDSSQAEGPQETVYVTDPKGDNLFFFNGAQGNATAQQRQISGSPWGVAVGVNPVSGANDMLYVTASSGSALYSLKLPDLTSTSAQGGGVSVEGQNPTAVAVSPLGSEVYVALSGNNTVEVFQREGDQLARPQQFDISQLNPQYVSPTGGLAVGSYMF
ncbi:MAG TPA: YncE family protein [Oscillatoriaceae cyanobacterium]